MVDRVKINRAMFTADANPANRPFGGAEKPRVRVPAPGRPFEAPKQWVTDAATNQKIKSYTADSFQNFAANLGLGANNLMSGSTYGFYPLSRNHVKLEWMYRGSWLVRQVVDAVADDMTRAGISLTSSEKPEFHDEFSKRINDMGIWIRLNQTIKWARLYGGCICFIVIDGQDPATPLRLDSIAPGQFLGLMVFDRWMLWPSYSNLVKTPGPDFGNPVFYDTLSDTMSIPALRMHHSRCIRFEGAELPYWQRQQENGWGISVIEPFYDRMVAYDSTTTGVAQLVFKAHLRTLKIPSLREIVAAGGQVYQGLLEQVALMRQMQQNEGITIMDGADEFDAYQYAFSGLSDVIDQFSQQLSGACQIPLIRLFGQSPGGLNASGDTDLRNYYDLVRAQQEARLRQPLRRILDIASRSFFGKPLSDDFHYEFNPLWQMQEEQKAAHAGAITTAVHTAYDDGLLSQKTAMNILNQSGRVNGIIAIPDEEIENAEDAPPDPNLMPPGKEGAPYAQAPAGDEPDQLDDDPDADEKE